MVTGGTGHDRCPSQLRAHSAPGYHLTGGDKKIRKTRFGFKRGQKNFARRYSRQAFAIRDLAARWGWAGVQRPAVCLARCPCLLAAPTFVQADGSALAESRMAPMNFCSSAHLPPRGGFGLRAAAAFSIFDPAPAGRSGRNASCETHERGRQLRRPYSGLRSKVAI